MLECEKMHGSTRFGLQYVLVCYVIMYVVCMYVCMYVIYVSLKFMIQDWSIFLNWSKILINIDFRLRYN